MRRLFEFTVAAAGLLVLSPLLMILAAAVRLIDGGPCFYRHARVGRAGRVFRMWKFRTMVVDADSRGGPLTNGADPRITALGRRLRRLKLDELPQLLNILSGDMGFVGPRPESPRYVDIQDPRWRSVLSVRPGITDLASLACRNEEEVLAGVEDDDSYYRSRLLPAKLALSLESIERRSWLFDLRLVAYTVLYSLWPRGFSADLVRQAFSVDVSV